MDFLEVLQFFIIQVKESNLLYIFFGLVRVNDYSCDKEF